MAMPSLPIVHGAIVPSFGSHRRMASLPSPRQIFSSSSSQVILPLAGLHTSRKVHQPPPGRNAGWAAAAGLPVSRHNKTGASSNRGQSCGGHADQNGTATRCGATDQEQIQRLTRHPGAAARVMALSQRPKNDVQTSTYAPPSTHWRHCFILPYTLFGIA